MGSRSLRIWPQIQHHQRAESRGFLIRKMKHVQARSVVSHPSFLLLWRHKSRNQDRNTPEAHPGCTAGKMQVLLFLMALLLPSGAGAEQIVDGVEAIPHSCPYMADLEISTDTGIKTACGGFLITRQFVMTAAQCKGRGITVTLGAHNLSKRESTQQKIKAEKQIVHPKYNDSSYLHDIMLLKLQNQAELTPAVGVIPLPGLSDFINPGKTCWAAGWGRTGVNKALSDTLREVKLRIMYKETCKYYPNFDYNFQVCVGSPTTLESVYEGDSGGPLVCDGVAHGIVSYGHGDAKPPAVFTRISSYLLWINNVLKGK